MTVDLELVPFCLPVPAVPGSGEATNVVGRESGHPDAHETYVQVGCSCSCCTRGLGVKPRCVHLFYCALPKVHQPTKSILGSLMFRRTTIPARLPTPLLTFMHTPQVEQLQKPLCGGSRPHFFRGVATVSWGARG